MGVPPSELFSQKMSVIISAVVTCMICSDDLFFIQRTSTQRREKKGTRQKVEKGKTGLDIVDKTMQASSILPPRRIFLYEASRLRLAVLLTTSLPADEPGEWAAHVLLNSSHSRFRRCRTLRVKCGINRVFAVCLSVHIIGAAGNCAG